MYLVHLPHPVHLAHLPHLMYAARIAAADYDLRTCTQPTASHTASHAREGYWNDGGETMRNPILQLIHKLKPPPTKPSIPEGLALGVPGTW